MATLLQIQSAVNSRLADFFPKVRVRQETYRANRGVYWQGIAFSSVPDDGALATPDFTKAPTDRYDYTPPVRDINGVITIPEIKAFHSWARTGVNADLPAGVEAQLSCDVYEGPAGVHGYYLVAKVSKNGVTYQRVAQVENGVVITTGSWNSV